MVTLIRSYAKQISINAIKKIGAPLLGLAKYIYYIYAPFLPNFSLGVLNSHVLVCGFLP